MKTNTNKTNAHLSSSSRRGRHIAFTLIEMLVVTAIISVLAALLMPSLKTAKDASKRAACMEHLHQVGLGLLMIGNENGGWINGVNDPYLDADPSITPSDAAFLWINAVTNFLGVSSDKLVREGTNTTACPGRIYGETYATYGANPAFTGNVFQPPYHNLNEAIHGYRILLVADNYWKDIYLMGMNPGGMLDSTCNNSLVYTGNLSWGSPPEVYPRHNARGLNIVFVDGHGEWLAGYGATNAVVIAGAPAGTAFGKWNDWAESEALWPNFSYGGSAPGYGDGLLSE